MSMTKAVEDVLAERRRQIEGEGWTPEHDDEHDAEELAQAAASYALWSASLYDSAFEVWPGLWDRNWFKPTDPRRDLVKAAALIIAEIERLDRIETSKAAS